jgi:hypothetical protein
MNDGSEVLGFQPRLLDDGRPIVRVRFRRGEKSRLGPDAFGARRAGRTSPEWFSLCFLLAQSGKRVVEAQQAQRSPEC